MCTLFKSSDLKAANNSLLFFLSSFDSFCLILDMIFFMAQLCRHTHIYRLAGAI